MAAVALALPAGALASTEAPRIVGGSPASLTQFPWQVFLSMSNPDEVCGGSILNATHVLTAAHCTDPEGTTVPRPPADIEVLAGDNNVSGYFEGKPLPSGAQLVAVSSLRVHPYYNAVTLSDDVAVLTLAKPLSFSSSVRPIALATTSPSPGTTASVSGYGQEEDTAQANGSQNGSFNWTTQTLLSDDSSPCASTEPNSAVMLCAYSPTSAACFGDSGGALVAGNPAVVIGVVSHEASAGVCTASPSVYANVTAPEIRDFIDGSSAPPVAPRPITLPQISGVDTFVDYSPITCSPGTWSGSPSIGYSFETTAGTLADPLQAGPDSVFTPTAAQIGQQITCTVVATNAGGTTVLRTGALDPIVADTVPPWSRVLARRCARRSCSFKVQVGDPNSYGAVSLKAAVSYHTTVTARCTRVRHHHRYRVRCIKHVLRTVPAAVAGIGPDSYQVTASHLPYGSSLLTITAIDAAGNRQRPATSLHLFTRRPKKHRRG